jgi:hypothetical protein
MTGMVEAEAVAVEWEAEMFLVHSRDGVVKTRCESCQRLYELGMREMAGIAAHGDYYARLCASCIAESIAWAKKIGNIPTRRRRKA